MPSHPYYSRNTLMSTLNCFYEYAMYTIEKKQWYRKFAEKIFHTISNKKDIHCKNSSDNFWHENILSAHLKMIHSFIQEPWQSLGIPQPQRWRCFRLREARGATSGDGPGMPRGHLVAQEDQHRLCCDRGSALPSPGHAIAMMGPPVRLIIHLTPEHAWEQTFLSLTWSWSDCKYMQFGLLIFMGHTSSSTQSLSGHRCLRTVFGSFQSEGAWQYQRGNLAIWHAKKKYPAKADHIKPTPLEGATALSRQTSGRQCEQKVPLHDFSNLIFM